MSQMSQSLQGIVAGNTSIKVAGGVSDKDARALAPDMRTTPDFLTNLQKNERSAQFAAYIRNKTVRAVHIDVPFGVLEKKPRVTGEEHAALLVRNKERYSASEPPASDEIIMPPTEPIIASPVNSAKKLNDDDDHTTPSKDY